MSVNTATPTQVLSALFITRATTRAETTLGVVSLPPSGAVTIGRRDPCTVKLQDPLVDPRHATMNIAWEGVTPSLSIEDRGTLNGTMVRGVMIRPGVPTAFDPGEPIILGFTTLIVIRGHLKLVPGGGGRDLELVSEGRPRH